MTLSDTEWEDDPQPVESPVDQDLLLDTVVLDAEVSQVWSAEGQVTVEHTHGKETGDLLVGADGIRSTVRSRLSPTAKPPVYAGYTTWRFITPPLEVQPEASESWGRGERVGIFPLSDGSIYSYLTASVPPGQRYPDDHAELWRRFGRWHDPIPAMLESVVGAEILHHDIYRLPPLLSYVTTRAALVGDAAQPWRRTSGKAAVRRLKTPSSSPRPSTKGPTSTLGCATTSADDVAVLRPSPASPPCWHRRSVVRSAGCRGPRHIVWSAATQRLAEVAETDAELAHLTRPSTSFDQSPTRLPLTHTPGAYINTGTPQGY